MASTAVLPAIPTSFGGTLIQANALTLPAGTEYELVDFNTARATLRILGEALFPEFPFTAKQPDPNVSYYRRKDVLTSAAPAATIVAVHRRITSSRRAVNSGAVNGVQYSVVKITVTVTAWHVMEITLGDLTSKILEGLVTKSAFTAVRDPETASVLIPTSGYLTLLETNGFILKPVAAGAPTYEPFYAAAIGSNPNV